MKKWLLGKNKPSNGFINIQLQIEFIENIIKLNAITIIWILVFAIKYCQFYGYELFRHHVLNDIVILI